MKHSQEEIIKALQVIKDECIEADECLNCPFYGISGMYTCKLMSSPSGWEIKEADGKWRAFK